MNAPRLFQLDRAAVKRSFARASRSYDASAGLQRAIQQELLERLQFFNITPADILDLGAGTGATSVELRRRYRRARIIALDMAFEMLQVAGHRQWPWRRFSRLCADASALPLADHSVDLVVSNLMLQWCDRPVLVFAELQRVLKPGGLLLFSTFGPATLQELREAWSGADAQAHVSDFPDMPMLSAAIQQAGLTEPVLDIERRVIHYAQPAALMRELRALGARNAHVERARGLTGRRRFDVMRSMYERGRVAAGLPATYEVIYGAAFASDRHRQVQGDETLVPLQSLRTRQRASP